MTMKFFAAAGAAWCLTAAALVPGETVVEPKYKLEWVDCSPMPFGKVTPEAGSRIPALRGVVFLNTRDDTSDALVRLLENARRSFGGKALIALVTPDDMVDIAEFKKRHRDSRLRLAVDMERKLTPFFMQGGAFVLPAGFLLDASGQVLWRGEAADLPEAVEQALLGKLRVATQRQLAPLMEQLQQALRNGNMPLILRTADRIFAMDPGNPAAVRMAVFAAESLRNHRLAWEIVARQKKAAPQVVRLDFTALELLLRHPDLRERMPALAADFIAGPAAANLRYAFADALLRNFPYDSAAILGAKKLISETPLSVNAPPEELAMVLALRARLRYALGDLAGAEENQREAVQFCIRSGEREGQAEAERMLEFFRTVRAAAAK